MISDSVIYPRIPLPAGVWWRLLWERVMRSAECPAGRDDGGLVALEQEFRALIARENATISKICFAYSGSVAEYDDLRQDALINIWRGMRRFRGESSEKTWIYRVTVNSCLSTVRSQARHRHESLEGLYGLIEGGDGDKEAVERMHSAIATLGPQDKAIIMMWLDDLGYDDIAASMGLNRNTVATKIRRIKTKIANIYNKEESI